jgi:hypothetical protein
MNPYEAEALMRCTTSVSYNGMSSRGDALIDTATSLNFVSKDFVVTNGFYKGCKIVPKLSIRGLVNSASLQPNYVVLQRSPLMDMILPICKLESYLTLKGQILYWDCQL